MADIELPQPDTFAAARNLLDDCIRGHADEFGPYELDEDGNAVTPVLSPILAEWLLVTYWVDPKGEHHYVRICSPNLPPHSRLGLGEMFHEDGADL